MTGALAGLRVVDCSRLIAGGVLAADNPRLVFARVSGWGQDGPYRLKPGFGTMVEAMSGFAASTGPADRPPTLPAFPMADMVAALSGATAVLAALRHRDLVSGRGQVIDISLYEPLLSVLGPTRSEERRVGKEWSTGWGHASQ